MSIPLSDLDQIRALKARYCRLADTKQWKEMATLFTDDAVLHFYDIDGRLLNQVTAAEFAETIGRRVGAGQPIHHLFSHEIVFSSDTDATGVWAMEDLIFHDRAANPDAPFEQMHGFGHYHDTYRLTADGWRIAGQELTRLRLDFIR
jgi:hypothetical protein